ncbi:hypothetical protein [Actinacidiphila oryziradicis]|uniref:Uncharacterized protein n=1 Tax=Actinacidiphila oryziradicis TaxID=2571141 RepID=A0A4U0RZC5_9ACTN|nr:hypothetical protein [Actinacidiphila oryziradicis]TKA00997.1 hypothetical protein FCI23_41495 [Actinacidiphila oryziradicis]
MTSADHGSGATSAREPDREKIDRIAAYVDDQRKAEKSWFQQWSTFTVYLTLAAFFFGIGTWSDLRNRIAGPPPDPAQLTKDSFVKSLETSCKRYVGQVPKKNKGTGFARVAADDLDVLNARQQMGLVWLTYSAPTSMAPEDIGASASIKSYYFAANSFLQGAIGRAKAGDRDGYALDVGLYRQANAAYLKAAGDFGFTVCAHYWGVDDVPQTAP